MKALFKLLVAVLLFCRPAYACACMDVEPLTCTIGAGRIADCGEPCARLADGGHKLTVEREEVGAFGAGTLRCERHRQKGRLELRQGGKLRGVAKHVKDGTEYTVYESAGGSRVRWVFRAVDGDVEVFDFAFAEHPERCLTTRSRFFGLFDERVVINFKTGEAVGG